MNISEGLEDLIVRQLRKHNPLDLIAITIRFTVLLSWIAPRFLYGLESLVLAILAIDLSAKQYSQNLDTEQTRHIKDRILDNAWLILIGLGSIKYGQLAYR